MMIKEATMVTIRDVRLDKGMTQAELAKAAGIARVTLSHMESGYPVRLISFRAVCKVLGLDRSQVTGVSTDYRPGKAPRSK